MSNGESDNQYSFTTRLLNADHEMGDDLSLAPPIHQAVNHAAIDAADFAEKSSVPQGDQFYARHGNPTSSRLARVIANLEGGETGIVFASGMGAIMTTLLAFLKSGDHVVTQKNHYIGTTEVTANVLPQYGIESTSVAPAPPMARMKKPPASVCARRLDFSNPSWKSREASTLENTT